MFEDILTGKQKLDMYRPYKGQVREKIDKIDLLDFVFTDLKLDGSKLTIEGVNYILEGGFAPGGSIREHSSVFYHRELLKFFADMLFMKIDMDEKYLKTIFGILTDQENVEYRKTSPVLYHLDFTPALYVDISAALKSLFNAVFQKDYQGDFVLRAVELHDGIVKIYPFEDRSELAARAVLQYELIKSGLFAIPLGISEQYYNTIIGDAVKTGNHDAFYASVSEAILKKLDFLISLSEDG